jgi:hypothetical protein
LIEGRLRIGDEDYALQLLSNVHREDPRRPIRELVENSADSGATTIEVEVNKKSTEPYVMCRDNGAGVSEENLLNLPERICNSIKREMRLKTGGVHGIGLLSFNTVGDRLKIVSRAADSNETNSIEFQGLKKYRQVAVEKPFEAPGTEVYIYGIDHEKRLLNIERLAEYLAGEFEGDLVEGKFRLRLTQEGKVINVTRDRLIFGTPIITARRIPTEWGNILVNLYYGGKVGVALTRRGITVVNNIASLPDIEGEVWKSGKVSGSVKFDSLNVSTDKKNPIRDILFKTLIEKIQQIEPEVVEWIRKIEEDEREKARERLHKYLAERLDEVLKDLNFDRVKTLIAAGKSRSELETEASDVSGTGVALAHGDGTANQRTGKPPASIGDTRKSLRSAYGINWVEESDLQHPKSRSRFDPRFGTIFVNKAHPDFTRRVVKASSEQEKLDYYYKLTIKEVVLHQFDGAPSTDVLDRLLDVEFAMEKAPPAL